LGAWPPIIAFPKPLSEPSLRVLGTMGAKKENSFAIKRIIAKNTRGVFFGRDNFS